MLPLSLLEMDNAAGKARFGWQFISEKKGFGWQGGDKSRKIPRHIAAELEHVLPAGDVREFRLQTSSGVIFVYEKSPCFVCWCRKLVQLSSQVGVNFCSRTGADPGLTAKLATGTACQG